MTQGRFITFPGLTGKAYLHPWKNPDRKFNSREEELTPADGLLTLKRTFFPDASKELKKATVRATALGIFDMFLNGERITGAGEDADELKPGWTDYRKRVFEFEYDVTGSVSAEDNLFVAEVSPGWWNGRISFGFYKWKPNAFCAEIILDYADGSSDVYATGPDWDAAVCGPVLRADIWDGEYYDARIPEPSIEPEAHKWEKAVLFDGFEGDVVPAEGPRIRSCEEMSLSPQSAVVYRGAEDNGSPLGKIRTVSKKVGDRCAATRISAGDTLLVDFDQNTVGRPVIFLKAPRG
ncbi:MAG: alpha-L-rhamnosidase N-terminal domain-containing protein [Clostridia bacterium]|nr:alpha-L-rhamnosidase N-terminal domain-containing protein [Clostridia bacterium]